MKIDRKLAAQMIVENRQTLLSNSTLVTGGIAANLAPVGGRQVSVFITRAGLIAELNNRGMDEDTSMNPPGTVCREENRYCIFVDERGDPQMNPHLGVVVAQRRTVLHEYQHILHGDVGEDILDDGRPLLQELPPEEQQLIECCAHGYSHERLAAELQRDGNFALAQLVSDMKTYGNFQGQPLLGPSDAQYRLRHPRLHDERKHWAIG